MHSVAFDVGYYTMPAVLLGAAYLTFKFVRGLYRKVTRD
jgi:hypothetical protein